MANSSYVNILFTALGGIDGSVMPIIWFIAASILTVTFLWGVYDAFVRGGDVRSLGIPVRFRLRQRVSDRRGGGAVMATDVADTLDSQTVRSELLAMYHARAGQGFLQSLLDAASDPIRPVDQAKRRRFHPLLVMLSVVAAIVAAAFVYFTLTSR